MAESIGSLFVEYRATADKFLADLKKMSKDAKEFERTIAPLKDRALDIGKGMSLVGGAVSGAFIAMAKQAANYGDQIRDASIRTGVSTEALSGLKYAAEQTGTSFEGINGSLIRMSRAALSAASGSKEGARGFSAIGVSVKDASGQLRPMEGILGDVADRFSKMKDGTEKAAAAQLLFGRNGAQMIEFLNQGKEGLAAFQKRAEELGLVVGPEFAAQSDLFNDSLNEMKNAQLGLSVTLGSLVLPALTKVIALVTNSIVAFRKFAAAHPEAVRAVFALASALAGAGGLLLAVAGVLTILPKLQAALLLFTGPIGIVTAAVIALGAAFLAFPKFRGIVVDTLKNVTGLFALLGSQVASIGRALMQLASGQFSAAWDTIKTAGTRSVDAMMSALDSYDSAVGSASKVTGLFSSTITGTGPALNGMGIDLDSVSKKADNTREKIFELANFLRGAEGNLEAPISRFRGAFDLLGKTANMVLPKIQAQTAGLIPQFELLGIVLENNQKFTQKVASDQAEIFSAREKDLQKYMQALENATEDVKRSAGKIFDDMFVKGENVFKSLKNLLKGGALSLGRAIFEDITGQLLGPIKLAFDNFFKGLLDKTVGGFTKKLGEQLGGALGKIGGASVLGTGTKVAGGIGGSAGSVAGGIAGAGTGIAGGLISGGLAAVGSIVGALMTKGNLKRTEENSRETRDWLELQTVAWNPLFHKMTFFQEGIERNTGIMAGRTQTGWRMDTVPVGGVTAAAQTINAPFNFAPVMNVTIDSDGTVTDLEVREMMAQMTIALETGVRGFREKWSQLLVGDPIGTQAPVGI